MPLPVEEFVPAGVPAESEELVPAGVPAESEWLVIVTVPAGVPAESEWVWADIAEPTKPAEAAPVLGLVVVGAVAPRKPAASLTTAPPAVAVLFSDPRNAGVDEIVAWVCAMVPAGVPAESECVWADIAEPANDAVLAWEWVPIAVPVKVWVCVPSAEPVKV